MDRAAKRELIDSLHAVFKGTGVIVVAHNTGMVAAQSADFRRRSKKPVDLSRSPRTSW